MTELVLEPFEKLDVLYSIKFARKSIRWAGKEKELSEHMVALDTLESDIQNNVISFDEARKRADEIIDRTKDVLDVDS